MQTVDNTKKKTKFFLLLICSAASQIISELFSEKLFRSQLCFFDDVDYTSEFFSNLYLKFLRHRFGLGRAATFGGDGLFL